MVWCGYGVAGVGVGVVLTMRRRVWSASDARGAVGDVMWLPTIDGEMSRGRVATMRQSQMAGSSRVVGGEVRAPMCRRQSRLRQAPSTWPSLEGKPVGAGRAAQTARAKRSASSSLSSIFAERISNKSVSNTLLTPTPYPVHVTLSLIWLSLLIYSLVSSTIKHPSPPFLPT